MKKQQAIELLRKVQGKLEELVPLLADWNALYDFFESEEENPLDILQNDFLPIIAATQEEVKEEFRLAIEFVENFEAEEAEEDEEDE